MKNKKTILFIILICLVPIVARAQNPFLVPFGGKILQTDYATCDCGFLILTIQDTKTQAPIRILYFYVPQLLELVTDILPDEIPIPRLYAYFNAFTKGVQTLGRFIPVPGAPCLRIIPTPPYCAVVEPGAVGYMFEMGTSLTPSR